jgi:hypothetical protein
MLKTLPLAVILQKNKKIETENQARSYKTLEHEQDPIAHPDPGSETASLITIPEEDLNRLKVPTFLGTLREWIYPSLSRYLADEELKDREEKVKRKTPSDDSSKQTPEEARVAKRRCMDGSSQVERIIGAFMPVDFANSLFDTELHVAVPLPFFLNKNLRVLIDEASTLPTIKSNPLPGESKGIHILDIEKLSARFGKELSLTCSQWSEAALNMFKFQQARDKLGDEGEHAAWFDNHFNFFNVQQDRDELYEAWKVVELDLRKDHRSQNLAFNAADHDAAFSRAKSEYKLRLEFQVLVASSLGSKLPQAANREAKYTKFKPPGSRHLTSQPFSSGSGRPSSSSSNCLICAEKGHNVFFHLDSPTPGKFLDGKPTWSKCTSRGLVTPDDRSLCINWNVRGDKAPREFACTHRKEERAHLCSFCGKQGHYALAWVCRQQNGH